MLLGVIINTIQQKSFKKQRMDKKLKDFVKKVKVLAYKKHLKVESLQNSAKLGRLVSESGKYLLIMCF